MKLFYTLLLLIIANVAFAQTNKQTTVFQNTYVKIHGGTARSGTTIKRTIGIKINCSGVQIEGFKNLPDSIYKKLALSKKDTFYIKYQLYVPYYNNNPDYIGQDKTTKPINQFTYQFNSKAHKKVLVIKYSNFKSVNNKELINEITPKLGFTSHKKFIKFDMPELKSKTIAMP